MKELVFLLLHYYVKLTTLAVMLNVDDDGDGLLIKQY